MLESKRIANQMPSHLHRWLTLVQRLPLVLMILFTISVALDNRADVGTLTYLRTWGVSRLEFTSACLVSTIYLLASTRRISWQSAIHFALGTLPVLFYIAINVFRAGTGIIPWTAVAIYLFAYFALVVLYWFAIGMAEWASNLAHESAS